MARRQCGGPEPEGPTTDHSDEIADLLIRATGKAARDKLAYLTAAELLTAHDAGAICLDTWPAPRALVELLIRRPILENGPDVARQVCRSPDETGSVEIAALLILAACTEHFDKLVYLTGAELLTAHGDGAVCLGCWLESRALVELLIGRPISRNDPDGRSH